MEFWRPRPKAVFFPLAVWNQTVRSSEDVLLSVEERKSRQRSNIRQFLPNQQWKRSWNSLKARDLEKSNKHWKVIKPFTTSLSFSRNRAIRSILSIFSFNLQNDLGILLCFSASAMKDADLDGEGFIKLDLSDILL